MGLSQQEMGGALRLTGNYVHMIETGKVLPSPRAIKRLCEYVGFNFELAKLILLKDKVESFTKDLKKRLQLPNV